MEVDDGMMTLCFDGTRTQHVIVMQADAKARARRRTGLQQRTGLQTQQETHQQQCCSTTPWYKAHACRRPVRMHAPALACTIQAFSSTATSGTPSGILEIACHDDMDNLGILEVHSTHS